MEEDYKKLGKLLREYGDSLTGRSQRKKRTRTRNRIRIIFFSIMIIIGASMIYIAFITDRGGIFWILSLLGGILVGKYGSKLEREISETLEQ